MPARPCRPASASPLLRLDARAPASSPCSPRTLPGRARATYLPSPLPPGRIAVIFFFLAGRSMECLLGLLKVRVVRGVNLAICDPLAHSSDPYVVLRLGQQKVKSSIKYHSINPEWNEELTLSITNMMLPVKIEVFDHDTFTKDDSMGDAEFCILDFVEIAKKDLSDVPDSTVMKTIHPEKENCFATESHITWKDGKVSQDIVLRLRNTETGEIILHLQWVSIPGIAK